MRSLKDFLFAFLDANFEFPGFPEQKNHVLTVFMVRSVCQNPTKQEPVRTKLRFLSTDLAYRDHRIFIKRALDGL